ncbi:hypothetical protein HDU89_001883 [Geranomyces variabilis]|nr:hypothetical protein HDU89_001883 [Geranomyces variabilis]
MGGHTDAGTQDRIPAPNRPPTDPSHARELSGAGVHRPGQSAEPPHAWEALGGKRQYARRPGGPNPTVAPSQPYPYDDYAKRTGRVHIQDEEFHIIAPARSSSLSPAVDSVNQAQTVRLEYQLIVIARVKFFLLTVDLFFTLAQYADQMFLKSLKERNPMQKLTQTADQADVANNTASTSGSAHASCVRRNSTESSNAAPMDVDKPAKLNDAANAKDVKSLLASQVLKPFETAPSKDMVPQNQAAQTAMEVTRPEESSDLALGAEPLAFLSRLSQQELWPLQPAQPLPRSEDQILSTLAAIYDEAILAEIDPEMLAVMQKTEIITEIDRMWTQLCLEVPNDMPHFIRHLLNFKNGLQAHFAGILPSPPPGLPQVVQDLRVLSEYNGRRRGTMSAGASMFLSPTNTLLQPLAMHMPAPAAMQIHEQQQGKPHQSLAAPVPLTPSTTPAVPAAFFDTFRFATESPPAPAPGDSLL